MLLIPMFHRSHDHLCARSPSFVPMEIPKVRIRDAASIREDERVSLDRFGWSPEAQELQRVIFLIRSAPPGTILQARNSALSGEKST